MSKTILNQTDREVDNTEYFELATSGANWRSKNDSTGIFSSVPIIIGGSAASSSVTIESTSGAGSTDAIFFKTGSQVERLRIDTGGNLVTGGVAQQGIFSAPSALSGPLDFQTNSTDGTAGFQALRWDANANPAKHYLGKSRGATIGSYTAVASGDHLGVFVFGGSDGTAFNEAAYVLVDCDATPANTSTPGRILFSTTPAGTNQIPLERLRITSGGKVVAGATDTLSVGGNADQIQNWGTDLATGGMTLGVSSTTATTSAHLDFYRSKAATVGTATVVASGDDLGDITWYGAQQTGTFATQNPAAQIAAQVDGTVTSGAGADMPGRLLFYTTADASGTLTERLRIDSTGLLTLAAGQIKFPATANPSADVNTLDDYEEGTWTPSVGGNATYTSRTGIYTKIGRLVTIHCDVTINAIGTGNTGGAALALTGLPFTVGSISATGACWWQSSSANLNYLVVVAESANAAVSFYSTLAAGVTVATNAFIQNATRFFFTISYII